jgi:hypothetical protein
MAGDGNQDIVAQDREQIEATERGALLRQQHLQTPAGDRSRAAGPEQIEKDVHAARHPNNRSSRPLRAPGMLIGTASPSSRRAASM